uniref:Uncharacterized protein n=1 Tax=Acrobeloides nanus TaxID=290746 RepID=A0A914EQB4_9BILA
MIGQGANPDVPPGYPIDVGANPQYPGQPQPYIGGGVNPQYPGQPQPYIGGGANPSYNSPTTLTVVEVLVDAEAVEEVEDEVTLEAEIKIVKAVSVAVEVVDFKEDEAVVEDEIKNGNLRPAIIRAHQIGRGVAKRALKKAWNEITLDTLVKIVDNFSKRLKACVDAKGGHFE